MDKKMPTNFNPQGSRTNTKFANLSKYLQANKGEGARMGQNIAENISDQTGQFQNALSQESAKTQEELNQEKTRLGQSTGRASGLISGITNATSAPTVSDQDVTDAGNILSDRGRAQGLNTNKLGSQANALSQIRANVQGGASGRQNLFSSLANPSNSAGYTGAQQSFDNLLLGKSQQGLQNVRNAGQQVSQATNKLGAVSSEAGVAAKKQNQQFASLGEKFKTDLSTASTGISDKVSKASQAIKDQETAARQKKQTFDTFASQSNDPLAIINRAEELGLISPELKDPRYSGYADYQAMKQRFSNPDWTRGMSDAEVIAAKNAVLGGINKGITFGADPNAISNTAAIDRTQAAQLNALNKLQGQKGLFDLDKLQAPARTQYGTNILDFYKNWDTENIEAGKAAEAAQAQADAAAAAAIANSGANVSTNAPITLNAPVQQPVQAATPVSGNTTAVIPTTNLGQGTSSLNEDGGSPTSLIFNVPQNEPYIDAQGNMINEFGQVVRPASTPLSWSFMPGFGSSSLAGF